MLLVIGWRGEPGRPDEPQHLAQGAGTQGMLASAGVAWEVIAPETSAAVDQCRRLLANARSTRSPAAVLVPAGTFAKGAPAEDPAQALPLSREQAIRRVLESTPTAAAVVASTGMISREVLLVREEGGASCDGDFLVVGGMGHCSQVALGVALSRPERQLVCLDGDGALLMHLGALAIIGARAPARFRHFVLNNGAHDSVGGQPTVALDIDIPRRIALACGYRSATAVTDAAGLDAALAAAPAGPALVEIRVRRGARPGLPRPKGELRRRARRFSAWLAQGERGAAGP
jgi:phosphonopyruvate decarboxylase